MRVVTADEMRRVDRCAQRQFGIPEMILMEHAGTAVARRARRLLSRKTLPSRQVLVMAGGGANGGDGLVAARHLDNWRIPVQVLLFAEFDRLRGAARRNLGILRRLGIPVSVVRSLRDWRECVRHRARPRLVVDALLGTGLSGEVREPIRSAIRWMNRQSCEIVAVDLPSGLCSDTGQPCGISVRADETVTLGFLKVGLRRGAGPRFSGRVTVAEISLPQRLRWEDD